MLFLDYSLVPTLFFCQNKKLATLLMLFHILPIPHFFPYCFFILLVPHILPHLLPKSFHFIKIQIKFHSTRKTSVVSPIYIISANYECTSFALFVLLFNIPVRYLALPDYYLCGYSTSSIVFYTCFPLVYAQYNFKLNYWYQFM